MFKCNKSSTFSIFSERKVGTNGAENGWKLVYLKICFCRRKNIFVCRGGHVREGTYQGLSVCQIGRLAHFSAPFISSVLPPSTHSLLVEQLAAI